MLEDKMSGMQNPIIHKLRQELNELQSLSRDQARTMPPEFYTSEDFLELEKEHIFREEWICLGHVGEIPNAGDFFYNGACW
jgi:choline monooxygenase